jgi:hypothetical protein
LKSLVLFTTILDGGVGNVCKLGVRVNLQNLY